MKFKDFHRNIQIRLIEDFIGTTIGTMIFPFMAIYFAEYFGMKTTGILMLVNVIIGIVSGLYGGYFADRIGRKKMMQMAGLLRIVSFFIMAAANSPWFESPVITMVMMLVNIVCWGFGGPASRAMLIDVSTPENRKYIFTISYWLTNLSITIGSIVGAFLIKSHRFELFSALAISSVLTWILVYYMIQDTYVPKVVEEKKRVLKEMVTNYKLVLKNKVFIKFFIAITFIGSLENQLTNYIGIRLENEMPKRTLSFFQETVSIDGIRMMGFLQTENTILVVTVTAVLLLLFKRFREYPILVFGLLFYTLGYSLLGFTNSPVLLLVAMLFATLGEITYAPITESKLADIAEEEHRSAYMAISGLKWNMGQIIASLFVVLGSFLSSITVSVFFAVMGLSSILLLHSVFLKTEKKAAVPVQSA